MNKQKPEDLLKRITINPKVMVGKPTIRGLRITVEQILKALAGSVAPEELLEDTPSLKKRTSRPFSCTPPDSLRKNAFTQ